MGQFVGCLEGMGAACRALVFPVVSGNVSLYGLNGRHCGPAIGGVGVLDDLSKAVCGAFTEAGLLVYVIGETPGFWDGSMPATCWKSTQMPRRRRSTLSASGYLAHLCAQIAGAPQMRT